jgi:hypothetical protein
MIWRCHISNLKQCANNPFRSSSCGGQKFCRGQPGGQDPSNRCLPLSLCPIARVFIIHYHRSRNRFLVRFGCLVPTSNPSSFLLGCSCFLWLRFCPSHQILNPRAPKSNLSRLLSRGSEEEPWCRRGPLTRCSKRRGLTRCTFSAPAAPPSPPLPPSPTRLVRYMLSLLFRVIYSSWIALGISMKTNSNSVGSNS